MALYKPTGVEIVVLVILVLLCVLFAPPLIGLYKFGFDYFCKWVGF